MYKNRAKRTKIRFSLALITTLVIAGGYSTYASLVENSYVVRTVHVFPSNVSSEGFSNSETVTFQNVGQDALFQEFNAINSATLDTTRQSVTNTTTNTTTNIDLVDSPAVTATTSGIQSQPDMTVVPNATTTSDDVIATTTSSDVPPIAEVPTSTLEQTSDVPKESPTTTSSGDQDVSVQDSGEDTPNAVEVSGDDAISSTSSTPNSQSDSPVSAGTSSAFRYVNSVFRLAMVSNTETFSSTSSLEPALATDTSPVPNESDLNATALTPLNSTDEPATSTEPKEQPVTVFGFSTSSASEGGTATGTQDLATATSEQVPDTTNDTSTESRGTTSTTTVQRGEDVATSTEEVLGLPASSPDSQVHECYSNCEGYVMRLGNFSYPLDDGVEISGAQFRLSFAADHKETRDTIPSLTMNYSLDGGDTWSTGGSILIEDEVSNSINGGYFLFALPPITKQATLRDLQVELRYDADPALVDDLFIESAWLELFVLEPPAEEVEADIHELLSDDGFKDTKLSGDKLQLPNGEVVEFTFTDDNTDETLIIKSDRKTYAGLSETETYFSVTNTSDQSDEFRLQTYFPRDVGEVTSLEVFNLNKPRQVIIPEYRPYVYHCEAGWEVFDSIDSPRSLQELSMTTGATSTIYTDINPLSTSSNEVRQDMFNSAETASTTGLSYMCQETNVTRSCDALEGDRTACTVDQKVRDHEITQYASGWESVEFANGELSDDGLLKRVTSLLGFGPDKKEVPDEFEPEAYVDDVHRIAPGETRYFRMTIAFPPFTTGEYWIEAVGEREYGLLDPFWSSQWQYRMPITVDNTTGTTLTEQQVFLELDDSLTDFWTNVAGDGSDVRFVQETTVGNEEDWYGTGWSSRTAVTIQASQIDDDLTDFPVYVDLADLGSGFFSAVQTNGDDIRITESDGKTERPYELVAIDTGAETGELHFNAASISSTTDTTFYVYHGNPNVSGYAATDPFGAEAVWGSEYIAVYHLGEDASGRGTAGLYQDSTSNDHDADDQLNSTGKTGKLGSGQEVSAQGDASEYILLPSDIVNSQAQLTFSYWLQSTEGNNQALINGGADNDYLVFLTGGGTTLQLFDGGSLSEGLDVDVTPASPQWRHVMVTRDASNNEWRIFIDGVEDTDGAISNTMSTLSIPDNCLVIGLEQDGGNPGGCLTSGDASQHLEGFIDEMRFRSDVPTASEASAMYRNQATTTDFYSVGSNETFSVTTFSELDFWLQHFSTTTNEADVWVQVDTLATGASTTIYLYYGSTGAVSESDEYAPFTYTTPRDLYYVTSGLQSNPIVVYSYIDNNAVSIDGDTPVILNSGETTSFATYSSSSVIRANGPITARTSDGQSEPPAPIAFATTTHITANNRGTQDFYVHAPFSTAVVSALDGDGSAASTTVTVPANGSVRIDQEVGGGRIGIVESDEPVLVFHDNAPGDSYVSYLPTTRDLFGVYSSRYFYGTMNDGVDVAIYCSSGSNGTTTGMTRGTQFGGSFCSGSGGGLGDGVRLTNATGPISASQEADGDGGEASVFLAQPELATRYILPTAAEYATIVCPARFGASTIEVQDAAGNVVDSGTCTPASAEHPGALNFTPGSPYIQGYQVVSTNAAPFYVYYEDSGQDDETNTWGAVQARAFESLDQNPYTFGSEEINIDAEYNQLSYAWYENNNSDTPVDLWSLGDDGAVAEGQAITGQGAVNTADVLRLRMNIQATVATGTIDSTAFALQYAAAPVCSTASDWKEIGLVGSTTAAFSGFNNSAINDGSAIPTLVLASSTIVGTYEEASLSEFIQTDIGLGEVMEFDWVVTNSNAVSNTEYCFRMVRGSGDELVTYTTYPQVLTAGPPAAPVLRKRFDNEHANSVRPTLEFVATDTGGDDLRYQVQIDTDVDFGSPVLDRDSETHFLEFINTANISDKEPFTSGQVIRFTPPSDLTSSTTYWWRVRVSDPAGSNTFSAWTDPFSFTIDESVAVSEWFQTTGEQFETNSLSSATTSGGDSIVADIGGSGLVGEYGSVSVTVGATSSVSFTNSFTDPVVVASIRYARSVPDGDQPIPRIFNKTGSGFDVLASTFDFVTGGTATVDWVVMESGEALIDNGGSGLRVFATSTSVGAIEGASIANDPAGAVDIVYPTSFSAPPIVLAAVTTNNDPNFLAASVYDGNNITNPPTASQVSVYLNDSLASNGHSSAEDVDVIVIDPGTGTNDGVNFGAQVTATDVSDTPITKTFNNISYGATPGVILVQQRTMNGSQGGYAMVDTDTAPTATEVTVAFEEGGTAGGRTHTNESLAIFSVEGGNGDIIRSGSAQVLSTSIDFDDADIGNAWGELLFTDSGDVTYQIQHQTGSGFALIPDTALPGNSSGFTTSPVNILSLNTDTYNELRLVADLAGASPELFDWSVTWGQRVNIPSLGDPFDNEKIATTTPTFDFSTTDPQGDALEYEISWSTDKSFLSGSTTRNSGISADFSGSSPYASGATVTFTIPPGDALTDGETYWWRVRARDPSGGNSYSPWSDPDSFTVDTSNVVSTWFQTTRGQFEEGALDGAVASTSNSVEISTEIGEYGSTTVSDNDWTTVTTELTYNNMVVAASPKYAFNGSDNGRSVQVRNKTSNSFEIKADNYTESLSGVTNVDYIVMEAGDWVVADGDSGIRFVAGTVEDVPNVEGSSGLGYTGGALVDFSPDFTSAPAAITTVSSANGSEWVSTTMDDGTNGGEIAAGEMFVALGVSLDSNTVRVAEDIDYIAFEAATGTNNGVLFDTFNTGVSGSDGITESEAESVTTFNQSFTSAPGVIVVQMNGTNGGDGGTAQVDTDEVVTNTDIGLSIAEHGSGAGNHADENVSLIAFESDGGTIRRDANSAGGLIGEIASEEILFSDGFGPKFERIVFSTTSPGASTVALQLQYQVSPGTWAPVPDSQIPGNGTGNTNSPIDLTGVDIALYPVVRLVGTLQCDASDCPTLDDWSIEWSEGVPISGTIQAYDRSTNVTSGTVQVAVNGVPGNTGVIQGDGTWTIGNVTALAGQTVTVWVDGADEANEAVTAFTYDGIGDMNNIRLYEQHLTISADENGTTTNADLADYDFSVSGNEDIFFDVDSNNDLNICAVGACDNANLYVGPGDVYIPDSSNSGNVTAHDFINDGVFELGANTMRVSGSWDNNASANVTNSNVIFTATSTTETVDDVTSLLVFEDVTFGETFGTATWQILDPLDVNGDLAVTNGTLDRDQFAISVAGDISTAVDGVWSGVATTTFDGNGSSFWSDASPQLQNIGTVIVDGDPKTVFLSSDVLATSVEIGTNDTLNGGGAYTLHIAGDFTNLGTFTPQASTIAIVGSTTNAQITAGASSLNSLTASTTGGSVTFLEPSVTLLGDVRIATGTLNGAVDSLVVGGSFINEGGVFAHNNGLVRFTSGASETIQLQGTEFLNQFYDVSFTGSGNWEFLDTHATTSNTVTITNGTVDLPTGRLTVARDFTTTGAGAFTANGGEVLFLIRSDDSITTNGSAFNDVRIQEGDPIRAGSYPDEWLYRAMISIHSSQIDEDLVDFPVYLDLADFGTDLFTNLASDGGDIRITTGDGVTEVPREVVSASTTAETGEVYFKAPLLSSTTDSVFYLYYGNATATDYAVDDPFGAENVWDSNYLAVYHMEAMDPVDSTSFNRDTAAVGDTPAVASGLIGNALDLEDNGGSDYLDLQSNLSELDGGSEMTVSAWLNVESDGSDNVMYTRGNQSGTADLLWKNISGNDANDTFTFNAGDTGDQGNRVDGLPTGLAVGGTWQYVTGAMQGVDRYIYIDGVIANTDTTGDATMFTNTNGASIGYWSVTNGFDYDGLIDEYRISQIERSPEWIAAEYRNMATTTDFYTTVTSAGSLTRSFAEAVTDISGDLVIESGQVQFPSGFLNMSGSFHNNGTFVAGSGIANFNATNGPHTIAAGTTSAFYDLAINGSGGQWTFVENATATNNISFLDADVVTVDSGATLDSVGTFTNDVANASTTWTGATLLLRGDVDFALNEKTNQGDEYNILRVTGDGDVRMWNSTAALYDTQDTASIYSQDHDGVDGDLYIFGDYVRTSGTEYWAYETDWDGVDLSASSTERQANVRIANGATVTASSSALTISGTSTASTTVDAQGGSYTLIAQDATIFAENFEMNGGDVDGFQLLSSTTVTTLRDGEFTIPGGASALTLDASTVDTNPGAQYFDLDFVTGGGNTNVSLVGNPGSFWWFRDGVGDRYGESFDDLADGDPGSVRWDDSNFEITISGTVYSDQGTTALGAPTCDGVTDVVRVVVDAGAYTDIVPCDGSGNYTLSNVSYGGDSTIIVYLDTDGGEVGSVITRTPTADITDLDVYTNHVITRHETADPMTTARLAAYNESDDTDLRFSAATGTIDTLTVRPDTSLFIWASTTYTPSGPVTLQSGGTGTSFDGSLYIGNNAVFSGFGTSTYQIGGSFDVASGGLFTLASSSIEFTATTSGKQIVGASQLSFNNISFTGPGGEWSINTDVAVVGDVEVFAGTVTGGSDITISDGSLYGDGVVSMSGGTVTIHNTNTFGGINPWTFANLTLGSGSEAGITTPATLATTTVSNQLTISPGHFLEAFGSVWNLTGDGTVFTENGSFIEGTSTVRYSGTTPTIARTTYFDLQIDTDDGGAVSATAPSVGLQVLGDLQVGLFGTSTLDLNINDPVTGVTGDVLIGSEGTIVASNSSDFDIFGNWENNGTFISSGGLVSFVRPSGPVSIAAGDSTFADLLIGGGASVSVIEHATTTGSLTIESDQFSVQPDQVLAVGGVFTNSMADIDTTWASSTLRLFGGAAYETSDKTVGDTYDSIAVVGNTHPRFWNSSASSIETEAGSSVYSKNHNGTNGELRIYGDLRSSSFADHWSANRDFDGVFLGTPRRVSVLVEDGGSVTYTGGSLSIIGTSTASTTIEALGAGPYAFTIGGNTTAEFTYYSVRDISSDGLTFTSSPSITDISHGDFELDTAGASGITVGGSVINVNQARNFTGNHFATTSAVSAFNVTATGTSVSSWRFINVSGNLDGEAFDVDPAGDPGYVVWEDSAQIVDISGVVYQPDRSTVSTVCDGTTNNIRLSIGGGTFASTSCAVGTGEFTFTDVNFGPTDTVMAYIDGEAEQGMVATKDLISSISNFDLYENHLIVRHENTAPMTIAALSVYDSSDDADVAFTAIDGVSDTLSLPSDFGLVVWNDKTFVPGGDVTLTGNGAGSNYDGTLELFADAAFTAVSGESHEFGGSLLSAAGAVFDVGLSTTTFSSTASGRTIDTNDGGFHNLRFTGTGAWTLTDTVGLVGGDLTITAGTLTLPAATTTLSGSFSNTGGSFVSNNGTLHFTSDSSGNDVSFGGSDPHGVLFAGPGSWALSDTNATTTSFFTVATGTVTLPSGTLRVTGDFEIIDTINHNGGEVELIGVAADQTITLSGNDLTDLTVSAGAGGYTIRDSSASLLGSLTIIDGQLTVGSGTLAVGQSFDVSGGVFQNGTGTVLLNGSTLGQIIDPGTSDLYNVVVNGTGGWTISGNATSTNNFSILNAGSFTVTPGATLSVGNVFRNEEGGVNTTWTNSTLALRAVAEYEISPKTTATEEYDTVTIAPNAAVSSWNTSVSTLLVPASASWYSQDHAGVDGDLYIYGAYTIATTTEHWSATTDFDGVAVGSRSVQVRIDDGASVHMTGGTLNLLGASGATTSVANQGSGTYTFSVTGGVFEANRYSFTDLDADGLQLLNAPSINSLSSGLFTQSSNSQALITLASTTINNNASLEVINTGFVTGGFSGGVNVSLDATTTNSWTFTGDIGDLWGESFDVDGTDDCSSLRWDDSACLLVEQTDYRWRNDDGGEGAPTGTWYDSNWSDRQRLRVINDDATSYASTTVKFVLPYDADMQSDFDDIRITEADGVTVVPHWTERITSGVEAVVWLQAPVLPAESVSEFYVYYGNVSATSSSDGADTFTFFEDFESGVISPTYSGDTGLFTIDGTYAYGGSLGLDNTGDETSRALDGIGQTGNVVSQGDTLRYMQYIDTSAGVSDEACTLFAVQTPVTANSNYAVCVQQPGVDRLTLARDVVESPDFSGTVLATSTVSLSSGWYEFTIDWQPSGDIEVTMVSDSTGSVVGTVSALDTTYSSGGIGFTYWFNHGGWDSYVAYPRTETAPTVLLGVEQADGGATWADAQNSPAGGFAPGDVARLRLAVENTGLPIVDQNFQIEFAPKLTAPTCEAVPSVNFAAVPNQASCGSSAVCMQTSTHIANGDSTTDHLVTDAGDFSVGEIVTSPSSATSNLDLNQNRYTELEYALGLTVNAINDAYCFRVTNAGTELDSYNALPELTLAFDPILDPVVLNDGLDITLTAGTTTRVVASTTVTDLNGVGDLLSATTTFYTTSAGGACTADDNNCYVATSTCSFSNCGTSSCTLQCSADFAYHANPTDLDGAEEWFAFMEVRDQGGAADFDTSTGVELLTLRALNISGAIAYGTVDVSENTGPVNQSVSLFNIGNESIDVSVSGTDMSDGIASVIPAGQQRYATSSFTYDTCVTCNTLTLLGESVELDLPKPVATSPAISDQLFWGIEVPFGTASNPHTGVNSFTAISD